MGPKAEATVDVRWQTELSQRPPTAFEHRPAQIPLELWLLTLVLVLGLNTRRLTLSGDLFSNEMLVFPQVRRLPAAVIPHMIQRNVFRFQTCG